MYGNDFPTPDGTAIRDYIHVLDLAQAHVLALGWLLETKKSDVFNLGLGRGISVKEVIDACKNFSGCNIPYKISARREGDPAILIACSEKAKQTLVWSPKYTEIETIISSAWAWHEKQLQKISS